MGKRCNDAAVPVLVRMKAAEAYPAARHKQGEDKPDGGLRSMIKSFKVKYSMELQDLIERV